MISKVVMQPRLLLLLGSGELYPNKIKILHANMQVTYLRRTSFYKFETKRRFQFRNKVTK